MAIVYAEPLAAAGTVVQSYVAGDEGYRRSCRKDMAAAPASAYTKHYILGKNTHKHM